MLIELVFHYFTIIFHKDFTGSWGNIHEDSPLLELAYTLAGL